MRMLLSKFETIVGQYIVFKSECEMRGFIVDNGGEGDDDDDVNVDE